MILLLSILLLACNQFADLTTEATPTPVNIPTGTISGKVIDSNDGTFIPTANVSTEPPTSSVTTDEEGKFSIPDVPVGNYSVTAAKSGYASVSVKIAVLADKITTTDLHLTINEIGNVSVTPQTGLAPNDGLIAYYPFSENVRDESGHGHHGIMNGAKLATDRFGKPNSAVSFDGRSSYVQVDSPVVFEPPYSVSFWLKYDSVRSSNQYIISNGGQTRASQGLSFLLIGSSMTYCDQSYPNGALFFGVRYEPTGFRGIQIAPVKPGAWHHIVGTWDGVSNASRMRLYIDGVQSGVNQCSSSISPGIYPPQNVRFGAPSNATRKSFLNGQTDNIRIYDRILSQSEVLEFYDE
jgi:hypothetical protein